MSRLGQDGSYYSYHYRPGGELQVEAGTITNRPKRVLVQR
jgi:hypothetical protein